MGNPLVRFCEGQESTGVWTRCCGTAAKAGGKRRRRTSSCSSGRLLPTRREVYRARDTKLDRDVAVKVLPQAFTTILIDWRGLNAKPRCWCTHRLSISCFPQCMQ